MKNRLSRVSAAATLTVLAASACSSSTATTTDATTTPDGVAVAAAFYPFEFVAKRVVADAGTVTTVTSPGVEPHDVELSPATVRAMRNADVVLYLSNFQPAVDDAIKSTGTYGLDVAGAFSLGPAGQQADQGDQPGDANTAFWNFWLDPTLLATYTQGVGEALARLDPANRDTYVKNAANLAQELTSLADQYSAGLAQCARRDIIVSHEAFGYLAQAYNLTQVGIAGIDPQNEPSPAHVREIRDLVAATGTTTVFTEPLINPAIAESLAADAGIATAVLDPLESVVNGDDYFVVMKRNLDALRTALDCG